MTLFDLPGSFDDGRLTDTRWMDEHVAWASSRGGAAATRRLENLGTALFEIGQGVSPPDTADVIAEGAKAVVEALGRHPVATDPGRQTVFIDVFTAEAQRDLQQWIPDALSALACGAVGIALSAPDDDTVVEALVATAFGADAASAALRGCILGKPLPDPAGGFSGTFPGPHVIDRDKLNQLLVWGTLLDYLQALRRAGSAWQAHSAWAARARAHATGIVGLDPGRGCAGDWVVIRGQGFGAGRPAWTSVQFPTTEGQCTTVEVARRADGSPAWTDTEITVIAPGNVGIGCVGFLVTDGSLPADSLGAYREVVAAAGMFQSVLGDAFGASGVMFGQGVVDAVGQMSFPSLPCPPCLPPDATGTVPNRFTGGPPQIRSLTVNGSGSVRIHPGDTITLAWNVEGADTITITAGKAPSSRWPAALPPVPTAGAVPAVGSAGPFPVSYDGFDDWDGEYVLSAVNRCSTKPVTATVVVEMRERPPLMGVCDTHVHFMSHLAFGGYGVWGRPHPSDPSLTADAGLADALPWCSGPNGHGPGGASPSLEGFTHLVGGHSEFDGWPRHTTLAHQQAYIDWIRRAVDGGLRLVVFLAVNNELLATRLTELFGSNLSTDDMSAVDRQLTAIGDMVRFVDDQAGGPGRGWMEIVRTPADARRVVAAGKLAIVLGVEVDSLGGWATPEALEADAEAQGTTPRELITRMLDDLYGRGVRHLFPVHATNNAFGGPAMFIRNYDAVNHFVTGASFEVETAEESLGISYRLDEDEFEGGGVAEILGYHGVAAATGVVGGALIGVALGGLIGGVPTSGVGAVAGAAIASTQYPCPPGPTNWASTPGGHINARGLTRHGGTLIEEMMRRGMLIDIDHMGHKTTEAVLARCEQRGYPVVSGHTGYRELKYGWRPSLPDPSAQFSKGTNADAFGTENVKRLSSEVDKSPGQLERIRALGGLVSTIINQRDVRDCTCAAGRVRNDSAGSSKSFAQAYLYAHHYMHGRRVALGTDINGAGQLPGPRFGPAGSPAIRDEHDWKVRWRRGLPLRIDQVFSQTDGVRYSSPVQDYRHHRAMDYGSPPAAAFDAEQRDFWEAIAVWRSGTPPETADQPPTVQRTIATQNFIINLATGLRANSRAAIPISIPFPLSKPWPFYNVNADEQLAAYLASHATTDGVRSTDPGRTKVLVPKLTKVWNNWRSMETGATAQGTDQWTQRHFGPSGSGLYDSNGNLHRSVAGRRDFDINLDGMAHYGMLPDLFQDLRNVGVQPQDIAALYRSAEDYIRVWERCTEKRLP